jgi:phosphotriesterase-related protein
MEIGNVKDMRGKAWTVLGPIDPYQLGVTLPHEHLFSDEVPSYFKLPEQASLRRISMQPLSLEILGFVRFNPNLNQDNMRLDDEDMMVEEVMRFKLAGGNTIVDATNIGWGRDPEALKRLSMRTGINVIASSGYYVSATHPPEMDSKSIGDIKNDIIKEISVGIGTSGVRAGLIGEIGTTFPWGRNEQKSLQGAGRAQVETGAPLEVHPGRNHRHPGMILEILGKEGVDLSRVSICHIDRTIEKFEDFKSILGKGCFIEFDLFGQAWYPPEIPLEIPMPSDHIRVHRIKNLIDAGYADRILLSHDIDTKYLTYRYGGHGYAHILLNIIPLMLNQGISREDIHKMLVENPRRFFTFA